MCIIINGYMTIFWITRCIVQFFVCAHAHCWVPLKATRDEEGMCTTDDGACVTHNALVVPWEGYTRALAVPVAVLVPLAVPLAVLLARPWYEYYRISSRLWLACAIGSMDIARGHAWRSGVHERQEEIDKRRAWSQ